MAVFGVFFSFFLKTLRVILFWNRQYHDSKIIPYMYIGSNKINYTAVHIIYPVTNRFPYCRSVNRNFEKSMLWKMFAFSWIPCQTQLTGCCTFLKTMQVTSFTEATNEKRGKKPVHGHQVLTSECNDRLLNCCIDRAAKIAKDNKRGKVLTEDERCTNEGRSWERREPSKQCCLSCLMELLLRFSITQPT